MIQRLWHSIDMRQQVKVVAAAAALLGDWT
jgi:hypothetical protein